MKTKQSGIVEELIEKHQARLARAQQQLESEYTQGRPVPGGADSYCANTYLFQKWAYRVGKRWYGFSVDDIPHAWAELIDDFLVWVESQCPDCVIHQIKIKWGKLCVHIDTKTEIEEVNGLVRSEIHNLEMLLRHDHLIH